MFRRREQPSIAIQDSLIDSVIRDVMPMVLSPRLLDSLSRLPLRYTGTLQEYASRKRDGLDLFYALFDLEQLERADVAVDAPWDDGTGNRRRVHPPDPIIQP